MAQKPSIPKGTRDFGPSEMAGRNYIFDTVRTVFRKYGYSPIETPAMENLSTLLGKYGEEGDKLLFKILNSGDAFKDIQNLPSEELAEAGSNALALKVCEKGLRYDLTVPFARFVVQHRNELTFPFKRYQIQPVWRADRPQKGRYREFYQCDVDVVGSDSLLYELEMVEIADEVFRNMGIRVLIKINNRKILSGLAEISGQSDKLTDITVAIDKIDKIGIENVNAELLEKGISQEAVDQLQPLLSLSGTNEEKLESLSKLLASSETGMKGIEELKYVINGTEAAGIEAALELDVSLARGLNYYTGTIIEVKANDVQIGSITGGGRYDNLTGVFGLDGVSGVGISFGADRIFDVLNQLSLYPSEAQATTKLMFVNFGEKESAASLKYSKELRKAGISCEVYPENAKMKKQMGYANDNHIPFVAIVGENELEKGTIMLKDMQKGEQQELTIAGIITKLS